MTKHWVKEIFLDSDQYVSEDITVSLNGTEIGDCFLLKHYIYILTRKCKNPIDDTVNYYWDKRLLKNDRNFEFPIHSKSPERFSFY